MLAHTLVELDPYYPRVDKARKEDLAETRALLEAEAPKGSAADPAVAEIAERARRRPAAGESGPASKQRRHMKNLGEELARAERSRR